MLSKSEVGVSDLLIQGLSNKQIAERLFVCDKTVRFHLTSIYKKTGVSSRAEYIAKQNGTNIQRSTVMERFVNANELPTQSNQGKTALLVQSKSQEDKITFIDEKFRIGNTIGELHRMMTEVTKNEITPSTVNAACNCVARLNETVNTAIQAARFLNER